MIVRQYFPAALAVSAGIDGVEGPIAGKGRGGDGLEGFYGPVQTVAGHGKRHGSRFFAGAVDPAKKHGMRYRIPLQQSC